MDFDDLESRLPTAMASFAELRKDGSVYVDKTAFVQKIAGTRKPKILTRPRRFGKSTLLSTIEELFLHGVKPYDGHDLMASIWSCILIFMSSTRTVTQLLNLNRA